MTFNGRCIDWKNFSEGNTLKVSAKEFDGNAFHEFVIEKGKPSAIKIDSSFEKGDMNISVKSKNRFESVTSGQCILNLQGFEDGKYKLSVEAKKLKIFQLKSHLYKTNQLNNYYKYYLKIKETKKLCHLKLHHAISRL